MAEMRFTEKRRPGLPLVRRRRIRQNIPLYAMFLPVIAFYFIFKYLPMGGLVIAFKNFNFAKGIWGSPWVGLRYFEMLFNAPATLNIIRNTFVLSVLRIIFGFPAPILLALMINEMRENWYKKTIQTVSYMPHFVALVVVCGLLREFCLTTGLINDIIAFFGGTRVNLLSSLDHYRTVYVVSNIWQNIGWNSIIYLSALSSVDASLHEAAAIDGAGRIRRIIHVNLPAILPVIIIQLILRIGNLMTQGYEKTILLYSPIVYEKADLISTYVYRYGLEKTQYSYGSAVGVFNSVANLIFLITANKISARLSETSLW